MLLYYVANNTNDYGTGLHKVVNIFLPGPGVTEQSLSQQFNYVVITDSLPSNIAGYVNQLTIDTTTSTHVVREKTESEKETDRTEALLSMVRETRDRLIKDTIWIFERHSTQSVGSKTLTDEQYQEWCTYWQALRDLPETVDLNNIVYPTPPSIM